MKKGIGFLVAAILVIFLVVHFFRPNFPAASYLGILLFFAAFLIMQRIHVMFHEVGHLSMGLLSGYRLVSFQVYNRILVRSDGRWAWKKLHVVGAAGQCLMSPPDMKNGKFPHFFYNLGGPLASLLFAGGCFFLFLWLGDPWGAPFLTGTLCGLFGGISNVIPLRVNGMPNDGYNIRLLGRAQNAAVRRAFWVDARANAMLADGGRARDFPAAWFDWIDLHNIADPLVASAAFLRYNYLLDRMELDEARAFAHMLVDHAALPQRSQNELRCELLFHELINECRAEEIERLYTEDLQRYIQVTAAYVSHQRLLYAYACLFTKDAAQAEMHLALFYQACNNSASLGEIPGEKELIAWVDKIAEAREAATS